MLTHVSEDEVIFCRIHTRDGCPQLSPPPPLLTQTHTCGSPRIWFVLICKVRIRVPHHSPGQGLDMAADRLTAYHSHTTPYLVRGMTYTYFLINAKNIWSNPAQAYTVLSNNMMAERAIVQINVMVNMIWIMGFVWLLYAWTLATTDRNQTNHQPWW